MIQSTYLSKHVRDFPLGIHADHPDRGVCSRSVLAAFAACFMSNPQRVLSIHTSRHLARSSICPRSTSFSTSCFHSLDSRDILSNQLRCMHLRIMSHIYTVCICVMVDDVPLYLAMKKRGSYILLMADKGAYDSLVLRLSMIRSSR